MDAFVFSDIFSKVFTWRSSLLSSLLVAIGCLWRLEFSDVDQTVAANDPRCFLVEWMESILSLVHARSVVNFTADVLILRIVAGNSILGNDTNFIIIVRRKKLKIAVRLTRDRIGDALSHLDIKFKLLFVVSTHALSMLASFHFPFFNSYPIHVDLFDCSSLVLLFLASNFFKLLWILILIPPSNINWSNQIRSISFNSCLSISNILFNHLNILIHILKHVKVPMIRFNSCIWLNGRKLANVALALVGQFDFRVQPTCLLIKLIVFHVFASTVLGNDDSVILSHLKCLEVILSVGFI